MKRPDVSDHAVLRYLERGHGLDVEAIRAHIAGLATTAASLGAAAVTVEGVKLVLAHNAHKTVVTTALAPRSRLYLPGPKRGRGEKRRLLRQSAIDAEDLAVEPGVGDHLGHAGAMRAPVLGGAEPQNGTLQQAAHNPLLEAAVESAFGCDEPCDRVEVDNNAGTLAAGGDDHRQTKRLVLRDGRDGGDGEGENGGGERLHGPDRSRPGVA